MLHIKKAISVFLVLVIAVVICSVSASAQTVKMINVFGTNVNVRSGAGTSYSSLGKVSGATFAIKGSAVAGSYTWYMVDYNGQNGWIAFDSGWARIYDYNPDATFEEQLSKFPESYREGLRNLHAVYPNWKFTADNVSVSFNDAVALESVGRRKEVSQNSSVSWRSMGPNAYDWTTASWIVDNGGWVSASRELIAYYMDPRNFLNSVDIIMYMQQGYNSALQTKDGVEKIVSGTFLAGTYTDASDSYSSYVDVIMEAARQSGVNPYFLASTIIQEQGRDGGSGLISGTYQGHEGVYNFLNVKASGANNAEVIVNGLNYAASQGWTTRSASIIGGAKFYSNNYISAGQDTYFYKDFNILNTSLIYHQYAQNVADARSTASSVAKEYNGDTSWPLTFRIPVYSTMPSSPAAKPEANSTMNNYYFTKLSVPGLTPTFEMYKYEYDLSVSGNTVVNYAVPAGASLASGGTYTLSPGENRVVLTVKAQSGYTTDYVINVNSSGNAVLTVTDGSTPIVTNVICGDTNGDGTVSLIDLANVKKHLLNIKILTGDGFTGGDTNKDDKISLIDLANIKKHLLGIQILEQ